MEKELTLTIQDLVHTSKQTQFLRMGNNFIRNINHQDLKLLIRLNLKDFLIQVPWYRDQAIIQFMKNQELMEMPNMYSRIIGALEHEPFRMIKESLKVNKQLRIK